MLGDKIQEALAYVGVTPDLANKWLGDCCCEERKAKLNSLDLWARRVIHDSIESSVRYLKELIH